MVSCPAWLVAAPASGHGKTTIVAALARLHTRLGRRVRVFKCGPDFLDPQIHALVSGAPCENIDLALCGEDDARWRLARAAEQADLILVEGVMGLYDSQPSGAELATRLGLPILLVIDASAMAGSFGAVVWGMKHYRAGAPIALALANHVATPFHAELCQQSLPEDVAWAGSLPRDGAAALPERHLGLNPAAEITDLVTRLDRLADALAQTPAAKLPPAVDFAARPAPTFPPLLAGKTIAVARDAAFCFIYPANLECLAALGARIEFFSPLADTLLPVCDAVWLPGGYPELHADVIAANGAMRSALQAHVAAGKPLVAECGGMMACCETLYDLDGRAHSMFALMPGVTRMQKRLAGLGLIAAALPEGRLTGHTFHYSTLECPLAPFLQAEKLAAPGGEAIYRVGRLTASYAHFYFPSNPAAVARLFG
ncbi:cobyrinate a,c-diamide synthase [Sulfuricystis multivorans]|uniref:cobyrinate a,c-diamide synthase n=1 Tax=Sulfuricystis multivorans TaxID=2211108 RepID=UPI000F83C683|nr:cobyrinate a,c-diamide synthase [Sulfuricystis multivorans]